MLYPNDFERLFALSELISRWVSRYWRKGTVTERRLSRLVRQLEAHEI